MHKVVTTAKIGALLLIGLTVGLLMVQSREVRSQGSGSFPPCSGIASVFGVSDPIVDQTTFVAQSNSTLHGQIQEVDVHYSEADENDYRFLLLLNPAGSGNYWVQDLYSTLLDDDLYDFDVRFKYMDGFECIEQLTRQVANTQPPSFIGTYSMPSEIFEISTNDEISIQAEAVIPDFPGPPSIMDAARIQWTTTIGSIRNFPPPGRQAVFASGSQAGSGEIEVQISYAGFEEFIEIPVTVISPSNGGPINPTVDEDDPIPGSDTQDPENEDDAEIEDEVSTLAEGCIINRLGENRYQAILDGARPSFEDYRVFRNCFAFRSNIVPTQIAPVAPEEVTSARVTERVKTSRIQNVRFTNPATQQEEVGLELSGTAAPNSDVLIYVFSEPLVLSTVADGDGNWSYTLSNPLEPGEHEVYAVVEGVDGSIERSDVVSFVVGTAQATPENPQGASLELAPEEPATRDVEQSDRKQNLFIFAAVGIVVVGSLVTMGGVMLRSRLKARHAVENSPVVPISSDSEGLGGGPDDTPAA